MDLKHLRAAVAVADHLHFGRAAVALGIAQPPLSQQIKALETELGVTLFERSTRTVHLTPAGEAFVADARTALSMVDSAIRGARAAGRGETGELAIGMVGSAVAHPLPAIVRAFRARYPDVTLTFHVLPTVTQVERLRVAALDLGLLRPPLPSPADDLELVSVSREPLVAVLPNDHRLAGRRRLAVSALADEPFVLFPRVLGPGLYDEITALCRRGGFTPNVTQEAVQLQTIVGLVAAGCGVSILPGSAAQPRHEVVFVPVSPLVRLVDLAIALPKANRSVGATNFTALAKDLTR
ncbi:LysR substrate-binding domain-containing protein [Amycolatopsis sp. EV170708-02-1]|uniref:LysR substrate-binding domain-containing protein n=1 Tax=Amycolatopsis sp. EV170708-02-1 TaxID=2919322 RepID=UPI001F0C7EB8|nr:LysR substrate-binding domain-containing protein [Amycolatopsis sp. EV170708-02-1]UMP00104.1 LysR substrate-binding domain-containing protein [Amycolatopsis sp. EV170708-02-1]